MTHLMGGRSLVLRGLLALLVLLAGALALQASPAHAVIQTQTWTGQDDGPTPDIFRSDIDSFFYPDGSDATPPVGQAGTINLTFGGTPVVVFCVDARNGLNLGTVQADVQEVPQDTVDRRALAYVLRTSTPTGASTPEKANQASVGQTAAWVLDGELRETDPSSDAAFNAQVAALVAEARAAAATPASLALSASAPAAGATTSTITVTGRPGAVVDLSVTAGPGSLSAAQVTIGSGGTATVTLTALGLGTVTVGATTAGDGRLFLSVPVDGSQETMHVVPNTLDASVSVAFTAAPATPQGPTTPAVTPVGTPTGSPGRVTLAIRKSGPARARVLQRVRYRITVRNRTGRVARNVVLRDRIPGGLSFVRSSRRSTVRRGSVIIRLGNLRPGQSRTVSVWMRAAAGVRGARVNAVTVSGTNVRSRRAKARTVFRPLAVRVQPAVTG